MKTRWLLLAVPLLAGVMLLGRRANAADHLDGPAATNDPAADITDVFAWMNSDASKVNLVMNVTPAATTSSKFSDAVQYVFHVTALAGYGNPAGAQATNIICTFDAAQTASCWVGTSEYVHGDASATSGLASTDGKVKVFAGLRDDPFFFNLDGFHHVQATVGAVKGNLTFDNAGCPQLDANTEALLVNQLQTASDGGAPQDFFAPLNVLSIAIQVDKTLLTTSNNPILGVWGSTNQAQ